MGIIKIDTFSDNRISGVSNQFSRDVLTAPGKGRKNKTRMETDVRISKGTVKELAKLTGRLSSSIQAIFPANLQSRFLQMDQIKGLIIGKSYEEDIFLSDEARKELIWCGTEIDLFNGKTIITPSPDLVITSDASNLGWGLIFRKSTGGT